MKIRRRATLSLVAVAAAISASSSQELIPLQHRNKTMVIGALLKSFQATHSGFLSFVPHESASELKERVLHGLIESVAALSGMVELVLLHDVEGMDELSTDTFHPVFVENLEEHRSEWGTFLSVCDMRWVLINDYITRNPVDCVFIVDVSDVRVLKHPGELCMTKPDGTLFVATDGPGAILWDTNRRGDRYSHWLADLERRTQYGRDSADWQALHDVLDLPMLNAGVVGGSYCAALEFLARFVAILRERRPFGITRPVDMLIVNELGHSWPRETVLGFPYGFVNLPFRHGQPLIDYNYQELAITGEYYFAHK